MKAKTPTLFTWPLTPIVKGKPSLSTLLKCFAQMANFKFQMINLNAYHSTKLQKKRLQRRFRIQEILTQISSMPKSPDAFLTDWWVTNFPPFFGKRLGLAYLPGVFNQLPYVSLLKRKEKLKSLNQRNIGRSGQK